MKYTAFVMYLWQHIQSLVVVRKVSHTVFLYNNDIYSFYSPCRKNALTYIKKNNKHKRALKNFILLFLSFHMVIQI